MRIWRAVRGEGFELRALPLKPKFIQTPSTFLASSQFIRYHLEEGNKIWQELIVKLCLKKFSLIMSDNFDRKVCNKTWSGQSVKSFVIFFINFTGSPLYG